MLTQDRGSNRRTGYRGRNDTEEFLSGPGTTKRLPDAELRD